MLSSNAEMQEWLYNFVFYVTCNKLNRKSTWFLAKMSIPRICIIGAGNAGMSTLIQLKFRLEEGCGPFDIVCFESQPTWGGVWNYNWRTGISLLMYIYKIISPLVIVIA